ncbi:unnamed protein product [Candida parapsilosis]
MPAADFCYIGGEECQINTSTPYSSFIRDVYIFAGENSRKVLRCRRFVEIVSMSKLIEISDDPIEDETKGKHTERNLKVYLKCWKHDLVNTTVEKYNFLQ